MPIVSEDFIGLIGTEDLVIGTAAAASSDLLLETNDYILLEDGFKLVLE